MKDYTVCEKLSKSEDSSLTLYRSLYPCMVDMALFEGIKVTHRSPTLSTVSLSVVPVTCGHARYFERVSVHTAFT